MTAACAAPLPNADLQKQVTDAERAFAASMKARDHAAFTSFLAEDTLFFTNDLKPLHGKAAVAKEWAKYYQGPAPFSWEPDQVEVLSSGKLAYSGGPVYDPSGKLIARYNSIWRLEESGKWKIVFDRGQSLCDCRLRVDPD